MIKFWVRVRVQVQVQVQGCRGLSLRGLDWHVAWDRLYLARFEKGRGPFYRACCWRLRLWGETGIEDTLGI